MENSTYTFRDLAKSITSGGDAAKYECVNSPTSEFNIPVYANATVNEGLYGYTNKPVVTEEAVTIAARGAGVGFVAYRKPNFVPIVRLISIVPKQDVVTAKFLYYSLKTQSIIGGGAAIPQLTVPMIQKIKISLPHISIQQKIASILSTYDTLIENNTKRIRLLEQMAENLYKEWFVRFRFPGHENVEMVKSKYGKVPSCFKIIKMQDAFEYYVGGGWGEEVYSADFTEEASVIRGADFPKVWQYDVSSCPRRFHKKSNYKARQLEDGDIVMEISGGTSEQPVGRSVLVTQDLIDRYKDGKVICASFCKLIRLKKEDVSPYYFYYWMKFLYDTRIIDRFQLQSTGIINFKFEPFLRKGDVMLPVKEVMNAFEKHVKAIHSEMNKLAQSNSILANQRDLLLPRLMSGKLEVKA